MVYLEPPSITNGASIHSGMAPTARPPGACANYLKFSSVCLSVALTDNTDS